MLAMMAASRHRISATTVKPEKETEPGTATVPKRLGRPPSLKGYPAHPATPPNEKRRVKFEEPEPNEGTAEGAPARLPKTKAKAAAAAK